MRRACVLLAALALAACKVDVEGARCTLPGSTAECPDGQACGNDLKCSTRAAACVAAGMRCDVAATSCSGTTAVRACVADEDPVCGSLRTQPCGANLACVERGQAHACECDANGTTEFAAGAGGSSVGGPWYPTGLANPPQCRFKRLGDALAAAVANGGTTAVKVYGDAATPGAAVTFAGEALPLVVPQDVTISGADAPAGETILLGDAGTSDPIVTLQGTLEGVHLQNASMTGHGVDMTCGTSSPVLRDVIVSAGTQRLAKAVTVAGPCGALLERVDASGATNAALDVAADAAAPVTVTGGRFHASGTGVQVTGGKLQLQVDSTIGATQVTDNLVTVSGGPPDTQGTGILLIGNSTAIDATMSGVIVARNGGTGIYVKDVPPASNLRMTSCEVYSNATTSPTQYGPSGRRAGGILLSQLSLTTFQLRGNNIYANHGTVGADELAFESSTDWPLTTLSCTSPAPNRFGCLKDGSLAVSVWPGTVDARFTIWPIIPPTTAMSAGVNPGASATLDGPCTTWSGTCPP